MGYVLVYIWLVFSSDNITIDKLSNKEIDVVIVKTATQLQLNST